MLRALRAEKNSTGFMKWGHWFIMRPKLHQCAPEMRSRADLRSRLKEEDSLAEETGATADRLLPASRLPYPAYPIAEGKEDENRREAGDGTQWRGDTRWRKRGTLKAEKVLAWGNRRYCHYAWGRRLVFDFGLEFARVHRFAGTSRGYRNSVRYRYCVVLPAKNGFALGALTSSAGRANKDRRTDFLAIIDSAAVKSLSYNFVFGSMQWVWV
ncbi:hypothetical protein C8J57DRAFT_1229362 [Mycena rebaudengoi]|nr:hypothetical protein C8J57DRAFT_1229362 [Mycena rebaudengoi]